MTRVLAWSVAMSSKASQAESPRLQLPRVVIVLLVSLGWPATAGNLTNRFLLALERVRSGSAPRYDQQLILADVIPEPVRRFTNFSGDVSGRYIEAMAAVASLRREEDPALDQIVNGVLAHQKPDGHFGAPPSRDFLEDDDMAMLWGNGRLLVGLLQYYRLTRRREVLHAAERLGDFLVGIAPKLHSPPVMLQFQEGKFAVGYICWTQTIEGLVELYRATQRPVFLDLAREIARRTERRPGQHTHGFLTSVRGIVALYEATLDHRFLEQAEQAVRDVVDSGNVLIHGAVPEAFRPDLVRDEGCAEADWLRLNLALWRLTGKTAYLETAERTLFNAFALNQFNTGDFGHRVFAPLAPGRPVPEHFHPLGVWGLGARAWWCCTLHGLRAFCDLFRAAFRKSGDVLYYELPIDGEFDEGGWRLQAESSLETDATVRIQVLAAGKASLKLAIRQPRWAGPLQVRLGTRAVPTRTEGGYHWLETGLRAGGHLEVFYPLRTLEVHLPDLTNAVAVFHGPWLLGVDELTSPTFFDEPWPQNRLLLPEPGLEGDLLLKQAQERRSNPFGVPVAHFLVDYLPGGYPLQPQRTTLRPLAEQTGFSSSSWAFVFRKAGSTRPGPSR